MNVTPSRAGVTGAACIQGLLTPCSPGVWLFFQVGANLYGCTSADEIVAVLKPKMASIPAGGIVLGFGFSLRNYDNWTLADLAKIDDVTGERLVYLADLLGHNAIINTALMERIHMSADTKIPVGAKIVLEDGRPTGMLRESAMILANQALSPLFAEQEVKAGMLAALERWASIGYTGCVDPMGATGFRFMKPEVFWELEKAGKLPLRVNYCYTIFNLSDVDDAAEFLGSDTALTHFVGCKIFVDGAFAGGQAWTSWENQQGGHGVQEIYADDLGGPELNLNRIVARVEAYGMDMHYHVQGDMAIKAVLDALDQVVAANGESGTHP
ncbi:MAG: amidohydrolase family protein [Anaerolineales bacterium]|nr:amidohydrolase family protein [Anaerolineales bacterium]